MEQSHSSGTSSNGVTVETPATLVDPGIGTEATCEDSDDDDEPTLGPKNRIRPTRADNLYGFVDGAMRGHSTFGWAFDLFLVTRPS